LETKHAKNPGLFPMFPFSCVSTSTLMRSALLLCTYCIVLYLLYCSIAEATAGTLTYVLRMD